MFARRPKPDTASTQENTAGDAPSDRQLVERTLSGDEAALAILHRRYYQSVYRMASFRTRNTEEAEDVAAETWLRAITHLPQYRFQGSSILPWLLRIAANLIADRGRKKAGAVVLSLDEQSDGNRGALQGYLDTLTSDAPDPQLLAERRETQLLLQAAIAQLPPDQAEVIVLRFGNDLPLKEIAGHLNRSEGAIKSLIHRALVGLRKQMLTGEADAVQFTERRVQVNQQQQSTTRNQAEPLTRSQEIARRFEDL